MPRQGSEGRCSKAATVLLWGEKPSAQTEGDSSGTQVLPVPEVVFRRALPC